MTNPLLSLQLDPDFADRIRAIRKRSARRLKQDFDYLLTFAERALKYAPSPNHATSLPITDNRDDAYHRPRLRIASHETLIP